MPFIGSAIRILLVVARRAAASKRARKIAIDITRQLPELLRAYRRVPAPPPEQAVMVEVKRRAEIAFRDPTKRAVLFKPITSISIPRRPPVRIPGEDLDPQPGNRFNYVVLSRVLPGAMNYDPVAVTIGLDRAFERAELQGRQGLRKIAIGLLLRSLYHWTHVGNPPFVAGDFSELYVEYRTSITIAQSVFLTWLKNTGGPDLLDLSPPYASKIEVLRAYLQSLG